MKFEDKAPKKEGYYWAVDKDDINIVIKVWVTKYRHLVIDKWQGDWGDSHYIDDLCVYHPNYSQPLNSYLWGDKYNGLTIEIRKQLKSRVKINVKCRDSDCDKITKFTLSKPLNKCQHCKLKFNEVKDYLKDYMDGWEISHIWTSEDVYWEDKYDCDIMRFEAA